MILLPKTLFPPLLIKNVNTLTWLLKIFHEIPTSTPNTPANLTSQFNTPFTLCCSYVELFISPCCSCCSCSLCLESLPFSPSSCSSTPPHPPSPPDKTLTLKNIIVTMKLSLRSFPLCISIVLCLPISKQLSQVPLYSKYMSDAVAGVQIP